MRRWRDENGQTLIMAALCMPVLMGTIALAVDVGMMFHAQQQMQTAADAAAVAASQELSYGGAVAAAKADAALNGVTDGSNGATVRVNIPPQSGPYAANSNYVEVIVSSRQPTFFMNVLNRGSMTVAARSVATLTATQNCVYTLSPTGTDINASNGVNVQFPGCAWYANSNSSAALSVTGGATVVTQAMNLVGGYSVNNGGNLTPSTPNQGIAPVSDPLAFLQPPSYTPSSCQPDPGKGGSWMSPPPAVSPGCYKGMHFGAGLTATLSPGMYVINGALTLDGGATMNGTGVTFYLPPGASLSLSNGVNFNLSAPTSGTYDGILFYQDRANSNTAYLEGGANSSFNGILYFPDANLTVENGTSTTSYASIVAGSLTFAGGASFKNYSLLNPNTPLSSPKLVE